MDENGENEDQIFENKSCLHTSIRMVRPATCEFLKRYYHSFAPGPNTFCSLNADEYDFEEFPWRVSHPIPVIKRKNLNWTGYEDPLLRLVKEKKAYQDELNAMQHRFALNKKIKAFKMAFDKGYYSKDVKNFIEKIEQDPDIYFDGKYDWNYTGGTMDIIRQPYFDYLFFATGENMDQIEFQRITTKNKLKKSFEVDLSGGGTIFEVIPSSIVANNFAVRQKFKNSIYNYQATNNERNIDKVCEFESEIPLISSAFDPFNNTTFCDLNVVGEVRLWDINSKKVFFNKNISPVKYKSKISCKGKWGALKNVERDVFIHCEGKQVNYIDMRSKNHQTKLNIFNFQHSVDTCEEISSVSKSKINPNLMYIGTYHKLFGTDLRFVKKTKLEMSSVVRWTHQLKSPPLMIKTDNNDDEEEIILLASPMVGDSKICVTSKNEKMEHISKYLPHKPYSIHDSFNEAQIKGYCIDPLSMLRKRAKLCNMGISLMCKDDRNLIFTQNSAGDIFQQYFGDKIKLIYDDVSLLMDDWMVETKDETISHAHATEILNMKSMLIPLMQRKIKDKETETFEGVETVKVKVKRPRWQRSINELHEYKDALASDILAIWDYEPSTDVGQALEIMDTTQPTEKVSEWLNRRPSTEDSKINLNQSMPVTFEQNDEDMDNLCKTFSQPVRKKVAVKRKYVKGF